MATDESHSRLVWLLSPTDMADLKGLGDKRAYEAGKTLFREGDRVSDDDGSDYAVLILSGRVRVTAVGIDGREVLLAERDPPDIVGELSAIDRQRRSATVTVIEPGEAVVIGAKTLCQRRLKVDPVSTDENRPLSRCGHGRLVVQVSLVEAAGTRPRSRPLSR